MKRIYTIFVFLLTTIYIFGQTVISVDAAKTIATVSPLIYGAGTEDVNHEIYGGLYDQRIFGESFEEVATSQIKDFLNYDNLWAPECEMVRLVTSGTGKLIYQPVTLEKGYSEVDVRLDRSSTIAGLILDVSGAGDGADNFNGYEISLNASNHTLVVGKHQNNWQPAANNKVDFDAKAWNTLRVEQDGTTITIYLNGKQVYTYQDASSSLLKGLVGLRSFSGSASFRHLNINGKPINFEGLSSGAVNFSDYDHPWSVNNNILSLVTDGTGKTVYQGEELTEGIVDVEMRIDGPQAIAGYIMNVSDCGNGADIFNGYEISLNASNHQLVLGKHLHNWQSLDNKSVTFNATDWNRFHVEYQGAHFMIYLNGALIDDFTDTNNPITKGLVGLRSFNGNVSFRNLSINGNAVALQPVPTGVSTMWNAVGKGTFVHDVSTAINGTYSQRMEGTKGVAIANMGLNKWGIALKEGQMMSGSIYLKGNVDAFVALQSRDGNKEYARQPLSGVGSDWQRFNLSLIPIASDSIARFVVGINGNQGTLWVDQAILHTDSYPFRADLTEAFRNEKLTFLRYGGTMVNTQEYLTKNMIGPREGRPPYIGWWYYNSTNGFAIPEFMQFARQIQAEPAFAINIEDQPENVLALLNEVKDLHLKYLEIGNEENIGTDAKAAYEHYVERFNILYDAIHPIYPDIKFVCAAWWRPDNVPLMQYVFTNLDGKAAYWDYHPWTDNFTDTKNISNELTQMNQLFTGWNSTTTMRCAMFEENGNTHNMQRALTHAMVLNAVRRTDGFVPLESPANALQPNLQNDNGWDQGQIFFSPSSTWYQPTYYAQQMASTYHQPLLIQSACGTSFIDATATRNEKGDTLVLHLVNPTSIKRIIKLDIANFGTLSSASSVVLTGMVTDENTLIQPHKIVPYEETNIPISSYTLKPYSYTIIKLTTENTTSISTATTSSTVHSAIFDLNGRPVSTPRQGIYIMADRKHIVK